MTYFLNFLLIKGTIPTMPEPRRRIVVGSGTPLGGVVDVLVKEKLKSL